MKQVIVADFGTSLGPFSCRRKLTGEFEYFCVKKERNLPKFDAKSTQKS